MNENHAANCASHREVHEGYSHALCDCAVAKLAAMTARAEAAEARESAMTALLREAHEAVAYYEKFKPDACGDLRGRVEALLNGGE